MQGANGATTSLPNRAKELTDFSVKLSVVVEQLPFTRMGGHLAGKLAELIVELVTCYARESSAADGRLASCIGHLESIRACLELAQTKNMIYPRESLNKHLKGCQAMIKDLSRDREKIRAQPTGNGRAPTEEQKSPENGDFETVEISEI